MTDRELLELAAKAAGIKIDKSEFNGGGRGNDGFDALGNAVLDWHNNKRWNPLTSDADAFRLMVKLKLSVSVLNSWVHVRPRVGEIYIEQEIGDDVRQSTRRAIVRAAAEIGRRL